MKIECQACSRRFRHYYLYILHVRDSAYSESIAIKEKRIQYGKHISVFSKILDKCNDRLNKYK